MSLIIAIIFPSLARVDVTQVPNAISRAISVRRQGISLQFPVPNSVCVSLIVRNFTFEGSDMISERDRPNINCIQELVGDAVKDRARTHEMESKLFFFAFLLLRSFKVREKRARRARETTKLIAAREK